MKDSPKRFGEQVRRFRLKAGWSQEELADRAGIHRTYIGAVERGETNISLMNIVRIADALSVHPFELLKTIL